MATTSDRGLFVWHEVSSGDVQLSERFYTQLVGWKSEPWSQNPSYKLLLSRREAKAGVWAITEEPNALAVPPHWLSYIGTADVDATVRQAVELGGKVVVPAYNVPNVGRMAHLQDPQGALFAVSAQDERSKYAEPEPGDFSWHELLTTNIQTAFDFYSKLFGWDKMMAMDMGPQGTYQIFGIDGHQLGGVFNPGQFPPGGPLWVPYVMVRDARRTAEALPQLAATVAHGPTEVPGGDWVFTAVDPQGAMFGGHSRKREIAAKPTKVVKAAKKPKASKATKKPRPSKGAKKKAKRR